MRFKLILLGVISLLFLNAVSAWAAAPAEDAVDPRELARKLFARIVRLEEQGNAIADMIGDGKPYKGLADKPVQTALTVLAEATEGEDVRFLGALNDCLEMDARASVPLNPKTITLEALLRVKRANVDAIARFLESQGVNVAQLREEVEAEKLAAAAKAMDTAPTKEEVFDGDFFAHPDLGKYLHLYLTLDNVREFFEAQSRRDVSYGWGEIVGDQRFPALFAVWGKTYERGNQQNIWCTLIEGIAHHFAGGDTNESKVDPYLKQFRYQDTWAINGHLADTHHKRTHDAFSYLSSKSGTRAVVRVLRGLGLR